MHPLRGHARLMVFKLIIAAAKTRHKLKGENQLPKVIQGVHSRMASRSAAHQHNTPPDHGVTQILA
jgi:hypothetical protein